MKAKSILISTLLLVSTITFAQKPDKESLGFKTIRNYPTLNIRLGVKTFSVVKDGVVQAPLYTPIGDILNCSNKGLRFVNNPNDAELIFKFKNVSETTSEIAILDDKHKVVIGPNGKPMKAVPKVGPDGKPMKEYQGRVSKSIRFNYEIVLDNAVVYSNSYQNSAELETAWIADAKVARAEVQKLAANYNVTVGVNEIQSELRKLAGTNSFATIKLDIYGAKQRKKCPHDYTALNNSVIKFKTESEYLEKDEFNTNPLKENVKDVITLWEEMLKESNLSNEEAKVNAEMTAALYYNLAIYNVLIKDFKTAVNYFNLSEKSEKGFSDAKEMAILVAKWQSAQEAYENRMAEQK